MNVPKLRFGEFSDSFDRNYINSIFEERNERGNISAELLSVTMNEGVKKRSEIADKDNSSKDKGNYKSVYKGDIVYNSMRMWQGANGVSACDGIVSPAYTVLKPKQEIDNRWFGYYFKTSYMIYKFFKYSQGLTSDTWNLKYPQISEIDISIPSLPEQQKIANFLSSIDEKVENQKTIVLSLEQQKKGFMQKLFSRELRFKDENVGEFADWEVRNLGDISSIKKGALLNKSDLSETGRPCILYGELYTKYGDVIYNVRSKTLCNEKTLAIGNVNDVLIPASGETALDISTASCLMQDNVILGGDLNIIRSSQVNGIFLSFILNHFLKFEIATVAQGSSVVHLYADNLKKLKIPFPVINEQQKIANFLSAFDEKIETEKQILTHWQTTKKALLQQMFI